MDVNSDRLSSVSQHDEIPGNDNNSATVPGSVTWKLGKSEDSLDEAVEAETAAAASLLSEHNNNNDVSDEALSRSVTSCVRCQAWQSMITKLF